MTAEEIRNTALWSAAIFITIPTSVFVMMMIAALVTVALHVDRGIRVLVFACVMLVLLSTGSLFIALAAHLVSRKRRADA